MKLKRIISTFLAVVMLASALVLVVGAEDGEETKEYTYYTSSTSSLMKYDKKEKVYLYKTGEYELPDGTTGEIETAEDKLKTMDYRYGNDKFELYIDAYSGEIALRDKTSGELLFSNPYDIGSSSASANSGSVKDELLSQIVVNYTDIATNTSGTYYSYTWAATRGQITVKNIKGGLRVEYTIGRVESRSLLPRMIEKTAMEEIFATIKTNMEAAISAGKIAAEDVDDERHLYDQFVSYYYLMDPNAENIVDSVREDMLKKYPIVEKCPIYLLDDSAAGENTIKKLENMIKTYCPDYTFEDLDEDHQYVEYEGSTESSPLFKMALEYSLDEYGLVVRLPANGIRFNETLYRLDSIDILPWMGAGTNPNPGYTFFPDGSGTLFDFQDIAILGTRQLVTGKIYGQDYAYHEISGMYEEIIRYPVFGIAETQTLDVVDESGQKTGETYQKNRGFVAIVEEGESLMELSSYHAGQTSEYNTVKMSVYPRPTDTYNVADAISVGSNSEWTVVSARKYTGNYKIRYMMLTDDTVAKDKGITDYYECSYVGMAKAYRSYLEKKGVLTRLTQEDVEEDIPLYIETFGALETTEKFLSIPFNVMTPLTSFGDIATMYDELKAKEVTNVNFVLTGYTKGGLTDPSVPYKLKWESAVSKEMDFEELTEKAKAEGFGLFPDFDFVFASGDKWFDGLSLKKHAVKTIDNRYTSKREYSATKHTYVSYFELALSPAYFSHFYEKFIPKYQKYNPVGISVSTLGSYLNSDFDEDEPYNRADGQQFTEEAFAYIRESFKDAEVMTSGGNAYTWKYVDHIKDVALDSSRFSISSAAVPFLGIVLHGYVEFSGTPINMEGNLEYAFLKALESGAALNFILSYRNTENLKEYETLSKYYSVRYDIWFDDVVSMYLELNELLKGVQTSVITKHEFLSGTRVPDDDELAADAAQQVKDTIAAEKAEANANAEAIRAQIVAIEEAIRVGTVTIQNAANADKTYALPAELTALINLLTVDYDTETDGNDGGLLQVAKDKLDAYKQAQQDHADTKKNGGDSTTTRATRDAARNAVYALLTELNTKVAELQTMATDCLNRYYELKETGALAINGLSYLNEHDAYTEEYREILASMVNAEFKDLYNTMFVVNNLETSLKATLAEIDTAVAALKAKAVEYENDKVSPTTGSTEYAISNTSKLITVTAFTYSAPVTDGSESGSGNNSGSELVSNSSVDTKYVADDNKIVYMAYDNGTAFLLNFNDYRVVVVVDGTSYTLDAYGYLRLSRGV